MKVLGIILALLFSVNCFSCPTCYALAAISEGKNLLPEISANKVSTVEAA